MLSKWVEVESLVSIGLRNELGAVLLRIGWVSVTIRRVIFVHPYDRSSATQGTVQLGRTS